MIFASIFFGLKLFSEVNFAAITTVGITGFIL